MIEDLKPYPEYKDSVLPWLGEVPVHWVERRAKYFFREVDERSESGNEELMSVSHKTGVTPRKQSVTMFLAESTVGYKICRPGDIAINTMWAFMGALGIARQEGIVSPAYGVYRPIRTGMIGSEYLDKLLRTEAYKTEYIRRSTGINSSRLRLYPHQFLQIPFLCPPPDEQSAIARFLAWATNRLDRAIGAKRKIIALLNEQKQAIIHRAVTRGLDPSVPMKDSGIPWLGVIPEHWEVMGLRMRYTVELGKMLDAKKNTGRHSIPYLRNRDVRWDRVLTADLPVMDITPEEIDRYTVQAGDLLVCEGGQVGRSAFWNEQLPVCGFQKALHRVRRLDSSNDYPRFLFYQMQLVAGLGVFNADGNENTIAHLTCEKLRSHRFAFPSLDEQTAIAKFLDAELQHFHNTISRLEREIELLLEYRTRLIADVVTGKLDVREVAAGLPEEELQDQLDASAGYDADEAEDDDESDLIDTAED
jgi:type I restriction enzyme S subunit